MKAKPHVAPSVDYSDQLVAANFWLGRVLPGVSFVRVRHIGNRGLCVADCPLRIVEAGGGRGGIGANADAPVLVENERRAEIGAINDYRW
jgi:hypothetical protein